MERLGSRPAEVVETLEQRIERKLNEATEMADRANMSPGPVTHGLAVAVGDAGEAMIVLSLADAARIAAAEARAWF